MVSFFLTPSFCRITKWRFVVCLRCFWSQQTVLFFELFVDCPLSRSRFGNDLFVCDCANASSTLFLLIELFDRWFLIKEARWVPYFQGQNKHNHSYNILTNNRLSDLIYPSLQHRALPYKSHASATAHCSNHQQCNQTWLKSQKISDQNRSHQKLPSHFQQLKGGFSERIWSPTWQTQVQEIYCNYIIQGQSLFA